jgi:hypothetical protein
MSTVSTAPSSDQLQMASEHGSGNHRSSTSIPSTGGADNLSVDISANLKAGTVDLGCNGDLSSVISLGEGAMNGNVFGWVDNATFAPLKLSTEPALANVQSELSKANLSSVAIGEQTGAKIQGNTGIVSGGAQQEH